METQLTVDQKALARRAIENRAIAQRGRGGTGSAGSVGRNASAGGLSFLRPSMRPALPLLAVKAEPSLRSPCGNLPLKCGIADAPA